VLSTREFAEFGKEVVLFLHVTSHVEGRPHPDLLHEKGGDAFPYFAVLDADGTVVARHQGAPSVAGFRATVAASTDYLELRDEAAAGDPDAKARLLIRRLEFGSLSHARAVAERAALTELTDEQAARIDRLLTSLEFVEIRAALRRREDLPKAGAKLAVMKDHGRIPTGRDAVDFWLIISFYAEEQHDAALFREVIDALADNPLVRGRTKELLQRRLEKIER
jgi:hypothetical protein